ncbi:hypothetical protein Pla123a_17440 [Posidoniimonas polymericola]|uniref:Putative restriction endonuclease domain-containing protein n=1 Tax=Posidoniimonas polymericola TaxID=2528002 RepID=A0A5C5YSL8_9BACT|nr:Uma2 family endonuclease [Posidoniimonas polymericola]TWT77945.1 hypothetical protein Pla123a_17440 [Posidoniimonas polymericola]
MSIVSNILDIPDVRALCHRMTVEQYRRAAEEGLIEEKTELIRGVVLDKMSKSPLHGWLLQFLAKWLHGAIESGWTVRLDQPLTLKDSEPEPDVSVVVGSDDDYRTQHPSTASLVIEIAISSEKLDRENAAIYAEADVDEYWIVLAEQQCVEVCRRPIAGRYQDVTLLKSGESLKPLAFPSLEMPVMQLFPSKTK